MTDRAVPQSRVRARLAGVLFLFGVLTAASAELFLRGRWLAFAAGLIAGLCHVAATPLCYQIFKLASPSHALLAVSFNFARAALEAVRWNPKGVDIAVVFHGWYGLLSLSIRAVLVRILGALMTLGGWGWLTFVSPPFANHLSPYNLAAGILGEGSLCLWLA